MRNMKPDIKYTTMSLSSSTTCRELVVMLLAKFRLRHRDPNLFYVRMEVVVRSPGGDAPARRLLVLDDHACPAELQQCRPRGEARFSVGVRRGGLLRVHDSILMPGVSAALCSAEEFSAHEQLFCLVVLRHRRVYL